MYYIITKTRLIRNLCKALILIIMLFLAFLFTACGGIGESTETTLIAEPSKATDTEPSKATDTEPSKATDTEPSKAADTESSKATDTEPSKAIDTEPSKAADTEPSKAADTEPSEEERPHYPFPFAFTTEDLYGNTVTEESIGEREIFFIHYWATWCSPCLDEMPELAEIAKAYGDRVGFIGLIDDYSSNLSGAKSIAESAGIPASFIMTDGESEDMRKVRAVVHTGYVPSTVIVDVNGKMMGSSLIGAYGEEYATILDSFLE